MPNYHIGSKQQELNVMRAFVNDDENSLILTCLNNSANRALNLINARYTSIDSDLI